MQEQLQAQKTAIATAISNSAPSSTVLIFDTETTGIPEYKKPSEDPCQPHLTEIAALLYTNTGVLLESFTALIRPDGWVIPDDVAAMNGITTEQAALSGIDEGDAVLAFMNLHGFADVRVAHNCSFDDRIMRIALKRYVGDEAADQFKLEPKECTALLSKPLCQLPPTDAMKKTNFKNSFKTPNLAEALAHFTGDVITEAHRALADAKACARVYFAIKGVRMPEFPNDLKMLTDAEEAERPGAGNNNEPEFLGVDSEGGGHD